MQNNKNYQNGETCTIIQKSKLRNMQNNKNYQNDKTNM